MLFRSAQKIGDLYASFMDSERIEKRGLEPIKDSLELAQSISDLPSFLSAFATLEERGLVGLFYEYISTDNMDSTKNIAYFGQAGLSLPDEAYYREDEYAPLRAAFVMHVERMFEISGIDGGGDHARRILALETEIASHHWDQVRDRDSLEIGRAHV